MRCPTCDRELQEIPVGGIKVDICKKGCGGIWFDNFELQKVDEQHETKGEALLDIEKDPSIAVDISKTRMCPRCSEQKLVKHFRSIKGKIEVDECYACGGVWLDQGELGKIRNQFDNEQAKGQAAKEYFADAFGAELTKMRAGSQKGLEKAQKFAKAFRFICPSYYIPGKQEWGAF
ncbi:MAG: zf-TFIIB domain-containing protein [Candidatus Omnitrophica bacterium]|nr:zf-TFIIB domain-containing protein [Candidatus Omnitrophota bacterium]